MLIMCHGENFNLDYKILINLCHYYLCFGKIYAFTYT